jgi:carboxyl-terminal processing protease
MFEQKLMAKIKLTCLAVFLAGSSLWAAKALCQIKPSPKQLVDEVWQILEKDYVDASFNHQDWKAIRHQYLSRSYRSKQEAYAAIKKMVAKLGDRYTEFFDPQEFQAINSELSGHFSGIGLELAQNKQTKALTVVAPIEGTPASKTEGIGAESNRGNLSRSSVC